MIDPLDDLYTMKDLFTQEGNYLVSSMKSNNKMSQLTQWIQVKLAFITAQCEMTIIDWAPLCREAHEIKVVDSNWAQEYKTQKKGNIICTEIKTGHRQRQFLLKDNNPTPQGIEQNWGTHIPEVQNYVHKFTG